MTSGERGSATVLLAFAILALATVALFSVHRSVLREWAMEGDALQGARAGLAADAALAWFLADWTSPAPGGTPPPETVLRVPASALPDLAPLGVEGEVRVRFLGALPGAQDPAWDVWRLLIQGRLVVRSGGRARAAFTQRRQAYVITPQGSAGAAPVLRAWRIAP